MSPKQVIKIAVFKNWFLKVLTFYLLWWGKKKQSKTFHVNNYVVL